jgi:hypothetical protein
MSRCVKGIPKFAQWEVVARTPKFAQKIGCQMYARLFAPMEYVSHHHDLGPFNTSV